MHCLVLSIARADRRSPAKKKHSLCKPPFSGDAKISVPGEILLDRSAATCPLVLSRLWRDLKTMGTDAHWQAPSEVQKGIALMAGETPERLFLEDMDFEARADRQTAAIAAFLADRFPAEVIGQAFHAKLKSDVVVVNDEEFKYLAKYATQVSARTQLTSNKTTDKTIGLDGKEEQGNLWYEETLPP